MKILYIADDGKPFDNESSCVDYEFELAHPHLKDIKAFDDEGNKLGSIFSDDTYTRSTKVIVPNDEALKDLQDVVDHTGYCCYGNIDSIGEWKYDESKETFVKER